MLMEKRVWVGTPRILSTAARLKAASCKSCKSQGSTRHRVAIKPHMDSDVSQQYGGTLFCAGLKGRQEANYFKGVIEI